MPKSDKLEFDRRILANAPQLYRIVSFMLDHMDNKGIMVRWSFTRLPDGDKETIWQAMHKVITTITDPKPGQLHVYKGSE